MMGSAASSWFWIWSTLVVIGFALLGYLAYRMVRSRGPGTAPARTRAARRILDERFARGEIDEAEYRPPHGPAMNPVPISRRRALLLGGLGTAMMLTGATGWVATAATVAGPVGSPAPPARSCSSRLCSTVAAAGWRSS